MPARHLRRRLVTVPLLVAGLLTLGSCGEEESSSETAEADFPMTFQNCDRDVTIDQPPERVLTIGAEAPTLVAAAGGVDRMVARSGEFESPLGEYESVLEDVPQLNTTADDPSTEAIIAENTDLVISRGSEQPLDSVGIDQIVISGRCRGADDEVTAAGTFEEFYADIELYGRLFGTEDTAADAVEDLRQRVSAVEEQFRDAPPRQAAAVIYGSGGDQLGSYGGLSMAHQQMEALGLTNVFEDEPERFFEPNVEELIERNPEVVVLLFEDDSGTAESNREKLLAESGLDGVEALQAGDIATLSFSLSTSAPVSVEGLEMLAEQINDLD